MRQEYRDQRRFDCEPGKSGIKHLAKMSCLSSTVDDIHSIRLRNEAQDIFAIDIFGELGRESED